MFRVNVVDVTSGTLTLEAAGKPEKLEALLSLLRDFGIVELSRTGRIALGRGDRGIKDRSLKVANAVSDATQPTHQEGTDEMATIYYEKDTDRSALDEQKIAVLGFGSQGHAHAQNLKDSGSTSASASGRALSRAPRRRRPGSACSTPPTPWREADVSCACCPTPRTRRSTPRTSRRTSSDGNMLMFAHGFSVHFGTVTPPAGVDVTMIAPKGPGHLVRRTYEQGIGTPALVAVQQDATGKALQRALAYGAGIGCARAGHHRDHLQGRDRDRPVRRADRAVRRRLRR